MGWKYKPSESKQAIRVNTMNIKQQTLIRRLERRGVKLRKIQYLENGYLVDKAKFSLGATSEYLLGFYSIQEAASQIPVTLFTDITDKIVLDACAAPGGKTVQMANLMNIKGAIVALDIDTQRLTALSNHLERCNVGNVIAYCLDARKAHELKMKFDRILLDVPCSGNFAADENWFRNRILKDVEANSKLQKEILKEATQLLSAEGEMVYSTCSLEPEEDEINMQWAIENLGMIPQRIDCYGEAGVREIFGKKLDDSIANCRRIWPGETQGFFACKLKRD